MAPERCPTRGRGRARRAGGTPVRSRVVFETIRGTSRKETRRDRRSDRLRGPDHRAWTCERQDEILGAGTRLRTRLTRIGHGVLGIPGWIGCGVDAPRPEGAAAFTASSPLSSRLRAIPRQGRASKVTLKTGSRTRSRQREHAPLTPHPNVTAVQHARAGGFRAGNAPTPVTDWDCSTDRRATAAPSALA